MFFSWAGFCPIKSGSNTTSVHVTRPNLWTRLGHTPFTCSFFGGRNYILLGKFPSCSILWRRNKGECDGNAIENRGTSIWDALKLYLCLCRHLGIFWSPLKLDPLPMILNYPQYRPWPNYWHWHCYYKPPFSISHLPPFSCATMQRVWSSYYDDNPEQSSRPASIASSPSPQVWFPLLFEIKISIISELLNSILMLHPMTLIVILEPSKFVMLFLSLSLLSAEATAFSKLFNTNTTFIIKFVNARRWSPTS